MRKLTDFIIWNHIFMIIEIYRCIKEKEYILFLLGSTTSILSLIYHLSEENKCVNIESKFAKATVIYIMLSSIYHFSPKKILLMIFLKLCLYILWKNCHINYKKIHPWMHIIMAIDAHYYINFYKELKR